MDEVNEWKERALKAEAERDALRIKHEGLSQDECIAGRRYLIEGSDGPEVVIMTDRVLYGNRIFQYEYDGVCRMQHGYLQRFFPLPEASTEDVSE